MELLNDKYLGKRLEGRYEIQELIGMGGMANVYKAWDIIDQQTVAVKILRDEFLTNTEFLRRFKNESKAIAVLSHPNIVRVFDVSFTNRVHSIVMEYIDGITLKDYIERKGALSWKEAVHFTLQILRALQHAHEKGIVHRDIKPQNIMLLHNGTIKVTDFGIARFARSEVRTVTDRAIGSVHYISPEQAMGENTDEKSDIYSVGVMLFEMLTGRLPFEAENAVSVALKQIQTKVPLPREINPDIPEGLEDITLRAMQKEAANRYRSAADMMGDIERFKQDPSIHFSYKYLTADSPKRNNRSPERGLREERDLSSARIRTRTPFLPILTGVAFAFVLASMAFVGLMIFMNNPFTKVPEYEVKNLVGLKFETAMDQYPEFEFIQDGTGSSDDFGPGVIYEQDPSAGRMLKEGATVRVKVSTGQLRIILENFTGRDASQVKQKLEDLGLSYVEEQVYDDNVPIGCVVYTDPSANSEVTRETPVTIYVSLGPDVQLTTVPDVLGLELEQARQILEMSNVRVGDVTFEEYPEPAGTV
ncbi:MAG: Stk1 family PASTA domain-containing Ser/Thr kinase, partial [Oscillospiraceae bacterium]|nr:Stk1 family PASTA domain-containing Ser/Thr kinase [Oscillospiraceae bacterium]